MYNSQLDNNNSDCDQQNSCQSHVHEFIGSVKIAGPPELLHNHRFAGVTSEVIPSGDSHVHSILVNTDFTIGHHHEVGITTGPAIPVGKGRHVHLATGFTTVDVNHTHEYIFATLIENPIGE